ncbi:MAG: FCSD flavin-binding domain-containing protein [Gammaproteobacteria bacterium]|jgi:sulfide dehydrogenase [flavocytochrome c] flavoprotein subunit
MAISRRQFIKALSAAGLGAGASSLVVGPALAGKGGGNVVVVGGGFGGATAAKYIRLIDPSVNVTLVEPVKSYTTCPGSNWVLGGLRDMNSITFTYDTLADKYGVKVMHDTVTGIDPEAKKLTLQGGDSLSYDRLVVSPGIDFRFDKVEGYDASVAEKIPHAWKAGPQTALLADQLKAMKDGGLVLIAAPSNPFRCPPGPYERASMIAHYLKSNKPKSKIMILDTKDKFSKQGLFTKGWEELYGYGTDKSMIEWVSASEGGAWNRVDAKNMSVHSDFVDQKADVINVIPPQFAGDIARGSGLADDTGWCPIDGKTFESTIHPGIHVIGDASIAAPLPKSGYAANSEAKVCAFAVVAMLKGQEAPTPTWVNTCYSLVGPRYGISVAMVYDLTEEGKIGKVEGSGGVTPMDGNRRKEANYAESWYDNITDDVFLS